jgi:hypothetical protein
MLGKLIGLISKLVKEFPAFMVFQSFITVFIRNTNYPTRYTRPGERHVPWSTERPQYKDRENKHPITPKLK